MQHCSAFQHISEYLFPELVALFMHSLEHIRAYKQGGSMQVNKIISFKPQLSFISGYLKKYKCSGQSYVKRIEINYYFIIAEKYLLKY